MIPDSGGDPLALPLGDPGALRQAAHQLATAADALGHFDTRAKAVMDHLDGPAWSGLARTSFALRCLGLVVTGLASQATLHEAAGVLNDFAAKLEHAIADARQAAGRGAEAHSEMASAQANLDAHPHHHAAARWHEEVDAASTAYARAVSACENARTDAANAATLAAAHLSRLAHAAPQVREGGGAGETVLSSDQSVDSASVDILFVRLGGDHTALVERKANGSWSITTADGLEAGLVAALGGKLTVGGEGEGGGEGASESFTAAAVAQLEHGQTWNFPNAAAAQDFLRKLNDHPSFWEQAAMMATPFGFLLDRGPSLPKPDETYVQGKADFSASGELDDGGAGARLEGDVSEAIGRKQDTGTGDTTYYFKTAASASASLSILTAGASGKVGGESVTSMTYDGDGRPKTLSISSSFEHEGSVSVEGDLKDATSLESLTKHLEKGTLSADTGTGQKYEVETKLDLAGNPANAAAAHDYLASLGGGGDATAEHALIHRMDDDGEISVRVYGTQTSSTGLHASAGDGAKLGVDLTHEHTGERLRWALTREPGALEQTMIAGR